jgi:hypothetical protein
MNRTVVALTAACLIAGMAACGNRADTDEKASPSAPDLNTSIPSSATTSPSSGSAEPDRVLCRVDADGTYFLWVTSGAAHNFSACDGATREPLDAEPFDFSPTMDLRCRSSDQNIAEDEAIIGVYSSTEPDDFAAATGYCTSRGMTPP